MNKKIYETKKKEKTLSHRNEGEIWGIGDDEYLSNNYKTKKIDDISKHLGRSEGAIWTRAHKLKISENQEHWSDVEIAILNKVYPKNGSDAVIDALQDSGFSNRSRASVQRKAHKLNLKHEAQFQRLSTLSQTDFYKELTKIYFDNTKGKLTYKKLSTICYVSYSRTQKWFAPGTAQQNLSMQLRHHFFLAIKAQKFDL